MPGVYGQVMLEPTCSATETRKNVAIIYDAWVDPEGDRGSGPPSRKVTKIHAGFLSNTGPDPLKNHKASRPAFNVGPLSARQRNAI